MPVPEYDADVIIVGGGPVGLTAAIDLDRRGISSVVIETHTFPHAPNVKCNHISSRTMERFRQLGIADAVRDAGLPPDYPQDVAFRTAVAGREFARIRISSRKERLSSPVGPDASWATPEGPHRINQRYLEPILQHRAMTLPKVTVRDGTTATAVGQDEDSAYAVIASPDEPDTRIRGRYLIGAEGGHSLTRKQIGGSFSGDPVLQEVQSTCIRAPGLYELAKVPGADARAWCYYTFNPRRSGHVYAINGRDEFLVHNYLRPDETRDQVDRDSCLRAILGVDESFTYEVISKEDWTARRLVADRFHDGRLYIAGDSAHLWVPYAGYGLNAGIADVLNLTWTLAAMIDGWAGPGMAQVYAAERGPITEQVSRFAMSHQRKVSAEQAPPQLEDDGPAGEAARAEFGKLVYETNVQQYAAAGLNYGYSYLESPLIAYDGEPAPAYTMADYTPSTVPGCRAPHFFLADGSSLYDHLGPGYTLMVLSADVTDEAGRLLQAAGEARMPLEVVEIPAGLAPTEYRHRLLLVREDQHVMWRGDALPRDPGALVGRLCGRGDTEVERC